ncbi:MAG: S-methyl-5-thioribose kinase [Anaerolineae bacterium]|nr:S-methyl-5-thioribose kinase [Thermoflexales bacterium]MDW8396053.1 S-methyl-5-thioribose kinase [Anaerolineae bacterium]
MASQEVIPLNEQTVIDYVRSTPAAMAVLGDSDAPLTAKAILEGNVNLLFRVSNGARSVLVKQALPYAWRYPDFKVPLDRARIEYELLTLEARYAPDYVVRVYYYDEARAIHVIEDLNQHVVMRQGLIARNRYPHASRHIGFFAAHTLFHTSDLYLPSGEKKAMAERFTNAVMRKVQEDLVFTQPYIPHPNNRWTPENAPVVQAMYADDEFRSEMFFLKERYMTHAQALIHNDLHTGSIMVNETETKTIDPEFAFFGPIGHDLGSYLANLALNYAGQEHWSPTEAERKAYRAWLLASMREAWQTFEQEWLALWEEKGLHDEWPSQRFKARYMEKLLQDTAGFGAAEIMRRAVGLARVADIDRIPDEKTRAAAERIALNIARAWLMRRHTLSSIDELLDWTQQADDRGWG